MACFEYIDSFFLSVYFIDKHSSKSLFFYSSEYSSEVVVLVIVLCTVAEVVIKSTLNRSWVTALYLPIYR